MPALCQPIGVLLPVSVVSGSVVAVQGTEDHAARSASDGRGGCILLLLLLVLFE